MKFIALVLKKLLGTGGLLTYCFEVRPLKLALKESVNEERDEMRIFKRAISSNLERTVL